MEADGKKGWKMVIEEGKYAHCGVEEGRKACSADGRDRWHRLTRTAVD